MKFLNYMYSFFKILYISAPNLHIYIFMFNTILCYIIMFIFNIINFLIYFMITSQY